MRPGSLWAGDKRGAIMENHKNISDEQIIVCLMNCATIREAAAIAGLSERAIYNRMQDRNFQALYKAAKADLIRGAVANINAHISEAINTIAEIMSDEDNNPAVRLQAAQTILNNAVKFTQRLTEADTDTAIQMRNNAEAERIEKIMGRRK